MSMSCCCQGLRVNSKTWHKAVTKSGGMNSFYGRGDKFCFNLLFPPFAAQVFSIQSASRRKDKQSIIDLSYSKMERGMKYITE